MYQDEDTTLNNRFVAIAIMVSWMVIIGGSILIAEWIF